MTIDFRTRFPVVDTELSRLYHRGIGTALVARLVSDLQTTDIEWLHVDFEPHLTDFYSIACGFGPTTTGLLRLR